MSEDLEMLRRVVAEPVRQMILAEVAGATHARAVARQIQSWRPPSYPVVEIAFNANEDDPGSLLQRCRTAIKDWQDGEPSGLLVLCDASPPFARNDATAGFWRGMNMLRERWDDVPTQTIFLVTPEQYRLFSTEADHLKRWVSLKFHLEGPDDPKPNPRQHSERIASTFAELLPGLVQDNLEDVRAAQSNYDALHDQLLIALQRNETPGSLATRYYLPLMAATITLREWDTAARFNKLIAEHSVSLRPAAQLRWLRLRTFLEYWTGHTERAFETARERLDLAQTQGSRTDKIISLWILRYLHHNEKNWDEVERYIQEALAIAPKHGDFLSAYAFFLKDVRHDYGKAEEFYRRAVDANPKHAASLNNYAHFLDQVRHDYDRAEEFYRRALEADPKRALALGDYAYFLDQVRHDYDRAEEFYRRADAADPDDTENLNNYANFLYQVRRDYDQAEEFYRRAIKADPKHALALGNYAKLLYEVRQDCDQAEAFYRRAIDSDPNCALHLRNYALFLWQVRHDPDQAEEFNRRAIKTDPNDAISLFSYARFLSHVRHNYKRADEFYRRALEIDPENADGLGAYAVFLCIERHDFNRAGDYFRRAVEAAPDETQYTINYAAFLLMQGRKDEGRAMLERAAAMPNLDEKQQTAIAFHRYIHFPNESPPPLGELKRILQAGMRAEGWSFALNIDRARQDGHPKVALLEALAVVIRGEADLESLDAFPEWQAA